MSTTYLSDTEAEFAFNTPISSTDIEDSLSVNEEIDDVQEKSLSSDVPYELPGDPQCVLLSFAHDDSVDSPDDVEKVIAFWELIRGRQELMDLIIDKTPPSSPATQSTVTEEETPEPEPKITATSALEIYDRKGYLKDALSMDKTLVCQPKTREYIHGYGPTAPTGAPISARYVIQSVPGFPCNCCDKSRCGCGRRTEEVVLAAAEAVEVDTMCRQLRKWDVLNPKSFKAPEHPPRIDDD